MTRVVRQFVPTANTAARVHLLDAGRWPVHRCFCMQIALPQAPPPPDVLSRAFDAKRIVGVALGGREKRTGVVSAVAVARRVESVGMAAARRTERWEKLVGL